MSSTVSPKDTATVQAWRHALDTYRKSLPEKDFKRIQIPAGPGDVLSEVQKWQSRQKKSKYCKVADGVEAGISRLHKFNRAIDMIAQGSPEPGCLVWGSIVFVLTIVQNAAEEYSKLCKTLTRMTECFPNVELYAEAFRDSRLIQDCVNDFYTSVLRFWTRACKFYRRHRLWNFVRVVWNDYEAEFGDLESDMVRCRNRIQSSALAEHIGEAKEATTQQQIVNTSLLEAQNSSRQKEIIIWLAPINYAVDYFMKDFEDAKAARHANTCQWLLSRDPFIQFCEVTQASNSFLWIHAQPGAGKTVLAAFLVDHFALRHQSGAVLFFFCKDTDDDRRTPIAIARSLLYQLFYVLRERGNVSALAQEISLAIEESGHKAALSFSTVWRVFCNHVSDLTPATIILDALDECRDSAVLIQSLRSLTNSHNVRVVLTSRKEEHLYKLLHQVPSLEVTQNDVDADIRNFVEAKVAANPRLSLPSVRDLVVRRLCESHEGMFLWIQYMVKELKSCVSSEQVQGILRDLPRGLDAMYQRILQRLQETLDKTTFQLCAKVLTWVTSSLRPLKIDELKRALQYHYLSEGHSLLSSDGPFPYSDKDIELVCGSLVTVRNETLQVVHLTFKQFIKSLPTHTTLRLLDETKGADLHLTLACFRCLKDECGRPIFELSPHRPIEAEEYIHDHSVIRSKRPFLEYACFSWLAHMTDCTKLEALEVSNSLHCTFDSPSTFGWIESCMALQPESASLLLVGLEDVRDWIRKLHSDGSIIENPSFSFVSNWCAAMRQILEDYGLVVQMRTAEVYYLDLSSIFTEHGLTSTYENYGGLTKREKCSRYTIDRRPRLTQMELAPPLQLDIPSDTHAIRLNMFIYEPTRDIFIYSYFEVGHGQQGLFAQSASSGRRLPRLIDPEICSDSDGSSMITSYTMSGDGTHLGIFQAGLSSTILEIAPTLDFTRRLKSPPWARIVHRSTIDDVRVARLWSKPCIAFDRNGLCYTPNELIRTGSGVCRSSPNVFFNFLSARSTQDNLDVRCAFCSENGAFLFVSSGATLTKYSSYDQNVVFEMFLSGDKSVVSLARPSGRYLAFVSRDQESSVSDPAKALKTTLLVDTFSDSILILPVPVNSEEKINDYYLHFSVDEEEVIACYIIGFADSQSLRIYYFDGLPKEVWLKASGRCRYHDTWTILSNNLHVSENHKIAMFATDSGEIQRIMLGDKIEFLDAPEEEEDYNFNWSFVTGDGGRWARLYGDDHKAQIQIHTVLSPDEMPRCIELQRTPLLNYEAPRFVTISNDFSIVILDGDIYKLGDAEIGQNSIAPQHLELPAELRIREDNYGSIQRPCSVDPSNSYVAYHGELNRSTDSLIVPEVLFVFRLRFDIAPPQMQLALPEDVFGISFQFHPSKPLLLLGYRLIPEILTLDDKSKDEQVQLYVLIIDTNTMGKRAVTTELNLGPLLINFAFSSQVAFSSTGDFAYISSCIYKTQYQIIEEGFAVASTSTRYIELWHTLAVDGAFYKMNIAREHTVQLVLAKPAPRGWDIASCDVEIPNLTHISSLYAFKFEAYLLLGRTDDEDMHVLIIPRKKSRKKYPPELKTIHLTWADAKRILNEKWEQKWGRPKLSSPVEVSDAATQTEDEYE